MKYRILILDTYYPGFLNSFYRSSPRLAGAPYEEQIRALLDESFGTADFYSTALRGLGHDVEDLVVNCIPLQRQWAREKYNGPIRLASQEIAGIDYDIVRAQIEKFQPDILYVQDIPALSERFLREIKPKVRMLVGQTACPLPENLNYSVYDLIITSFPHYVQMFRDCGVASEYVKLAFEGTVLDRIKRSNLPLQYDVAFVGSYTTAHRQGTDLLERLGNALTVDFWGFGQESLSAQSPIRRRFHGEAWGLEMFKVLAQSKIVVNRHINVAGNFANNMRLFETTGMGALLLTDQKMNLTDLFEPGREVVAYNSIEECIELARHYLQNEPERQAIAGAGQERTLKEHTYTRRAQEMEEIFADYWNGKPASQRAAGVSLGRPRLPASGSGSGAGLRLDETVAWAKRTLRDVPGSRLAWRIARRALGSRQSEGPSSGYRVISQSQITEEFVDGWKSNAIPDQQRNLVADQLRLMYQGEPIPIFSILAEAVQATGSAEGKIVEVGCASGYYSEVLTHLLQHPIDYLGVDYSEALIEQAQRYYPNISFRVGDACDLPLPEASCDVLISGCVLLHVPDYEKAISETARVTRKWAIFHRTPVIQRNPTTFYTKLAYGVPCVEVAFNERELFDLFGKYGLVVERTWDTGEKGHDGLTEPAEGKTYLCRLMQGM